MLQTLEIDQYTRAGFVHPLQLMTSAQVAQCRAHFKVIEQELGAPLLRFEWAHLFFPWAYELVTNPVLLDAIEALMGPEIVIWGSLIANKPPESDFNFAWHQDSAFCKFIGSSPAATAWIALTESNQQNGCLEVLPQSHKSEITHTTVLSDENILRQKQEVAAVIDSALVEDVILQPGEMSIQHMSLLHKSSGNRSNSERTGFIVRFATPEMKECPYPVIHARGTADCSHLDVWDAPGDMDLAKGLKGREDLIAALS